MLNFSIIIHIFVCQYSLCYYWYCYNQKQSSGVVLQKRCSYKFRKIHKKTPKKRFRYRCFLVNSAKSLVISFLKKPSDGCFNVNTGPAACHDLSPFQQRFHPYFLAEYFFFGLICRLGVKVSSIFQRLRQKPIFKPMEHLQWSFFLRK